MRKRFLSLALALAMVVGLLPAAALATLIPASASDGSGVSTQAANQGTYQVTFVRDAFETTEVTVHSVIGNGQGQALPVTSSTLDGMRLQIGEDAMDANGLAGGYGLLNVEHTDGSFYYLTSATWGPSGGSVGEFGYDDVVTHRGEGIYLHYTRAEDVEINVTAVNGNANDQQIVTGTIPSGVITEARAQEVVANDVNTWYFNQAELRPRTGGGSPVPIDSIRLENGTYYVTTEETAQAQVAFDPDDWNVYLVYEPGRELTVNVQLTSGAGSFNTINGVPVTELGSGTSFQVVYQVPADGFRDIVFRMGDGANLNLTEGENILFASSRDGYEQKTYTLPLIGSGGNRVVTAEFIGISNSKILDYAVYSNHRENYHGFTLDLNNTPLNTNNTTASIGNSFSLRLNFGYSDGYVFVPNRISVNGTWINIPWPRMDYGIDSQWIDSQWDHSSQNTFSTTIYDSLETPQAVVTATLNYRWSLGNLSPNCSLTLAFSDVSNNLRIDFMNLVNAKNYTETSMAGIGEGIEQLRYATGNPGGNLGAYITLPNAQGWNKTTNINIYADVSWDYYITQFQLRSPSQDNWSTATFTPATNQSGPDGQTANDRWYGDKAYRFMGTTQQNYQNHNNSVHMTGHQQAELMTAPIEFTLRYDQDGAEGGQYLATSDRQTFEDGAIGVSDLIAPQAPKGQVFMGWSLYPSTSNDRGALLQSGGTLSRGVVDADHAALVHYTNTTGQAYIDLYPVFESTTSAEYASYTVIIHRGASDVGGTPVAGSSIAGSLLDRDSVLNLPAVRTVLESSSMTGYALDGSRSDTLVELTSGGSNTFHLWYNNTNPVTITFVSEHGFDGREGTQLEVQLTPGTLIGSNAPTPVTAGAGVGSFVGWTTTEGATFVEAASLNNIVVPSEATTYYAIYMPDVTLSFYDYDGTDWEEQPYEITLTYNTQLSEE